MTKTHYFSTGKANLCIVELPEKYKRIQLGEVGITDGTGRWVSLGVQIRERLPDEPVDEYLKTQVIVIKCVNQPLAGWSILGPVKDITEEQAAAIVKRKWSKGNSFDNSVPIGYVDYRNADHFCNTALEAFATLLQCIPIYTDNPHGEKQPECHCVKPFTPKAERRACREKIEAWTEAEQNVFRNSILLVNNGEVKA